MAFDRGLAERVRLAAARRRGVSEKAMFGGLAFLLDGKMFCGVLGDEILVRVGPERNDEALARPHVRPMDFTGRPMKGYVFVGAAALRDGRALSRWVALGADFAASLSRGEVSPRARAGRARSSSSRASSRRAAPRRPGSRRRRP